MSSPTLSTGQTVPSSDPGGSPGDSGGGMQRGASYFFGFLITFVVLLLIFVGCGVVSRRRFSARQRARFEWDMEPWAEMMDGGVGYVAPVLLEKRFAFARDGSLWKDMTPLAALVASPRQEKRVTDVSKDAPTPAPTLNANQRPSSPPVYGGRDIDNLQLISRTLSAASRTRSEDLTRVGSGHSGLVRITSPMPYHRNPNVIAAQEDWRQQQQQRQVGQEPLDVQGREPVSQRRGWLHLLMPTSWLRPLTPRRRERGHSGDMEQGPQGASYDEKPRKEMLKEKKDLMLQVAMLIQMPSQTSYTSAPVFEIGVASIPWMDNLQAHSYPIRRSSASSESD